ncbi:cyclin-dependent kinase 5 activator 1-like [Pseudophryne corroboree]|uniref:cyclin-dependent kinase 5 activator 1-like n=1 Tax=Pseudophryne corroboree TaxID=495146 RepID=UPI003081754A
MWNGFPFSCCRKASLPDEDSSTGAHRTAVEDSETGRSGERRSLIWRFRRFMAKKRQPKNGQTDVTHLVSESLKSSLSCVDLSTYTQATHDTFAKREAPDGCGSAKYQMVQATTSELLSCLGEFIHPRCKKLKNLSPTQIALWMTSIDRYLSGCGQLVGFLTPANVVFLYMLCREVIPSELDSEQELHAYLSTCLYLAFTYMGSETGYPLRPFLVESSKEAYWSRCLYVIDLMSSKMLRINADRQYFIQIFGDLRAEAGQENTTMA